MRAFIFLGSAALALSSVGHTNAQLAARVTPDLAFHFHCDQVAPSTLENKIQKFLERSGFRVLNQARIQREHDSAIFDILIFGLDRKGGIFNFTALPGSGGRYAASLITPPPTVRSVDLEASTLNLISKDLSCDIRQVSRSENSADTRDAYEQHYNRIEDLYRQAEELRGQRRM